MWSKKIDVTKELMSIIEWLINNQEMEVTISTSYSKQELPLKYFWQRCILLLLERIWWPDTIVNLSHSHLKSFQISKFLNTSSLSLYFHHLHYDLAFFFEFFCFVFLQRNNSSQKLLYLWKRKQTLGKRVYIAREGGRSKFIS